MKNWTTFEDIILKLKHSGMIMSAHFIETIKPGFNLTKIFDMGLFVFSTISRKRFAKPRYVFLSFSICLLRYMLWLYIELDR